MLSKIIKSNLKGVLSLYKRHAGNIRDIDRCFDNVLPAKEKDECAPGKKGLVIGVFNNDGDMKLTPAAQKFNDQVGGKLVDFVRDSPKPLNLGQSILFHNLDPEYYTVVLVGLGKEEVGYNKSEDLDECRENIRIAAGAAARKLKNEGLESVHIESFGNAEAAVEGGLLGIWKYQDFVNKDDQLPIPSVELYSSGEKAEEQEWSKGYIKGEAQNIARKLADTPANCMTPTSFAQAAADILCPLGVQIDVKNRDWMESQKMNAFLAVARGSCELPMLLEINYCGTGPEEKPVVLIGKGITFDSSGICLNTPQKMSEKRADMTGAAVVVAAIKAAAALGVTMNIRGVIPLCENMISGMAVRPGDIVHSMMGKTILVQDTGHEGRLCVADTLTYVQNEYKPKYVVDVATLSMGMRRAIGTGATGVFVNNDSLWEKLRESGSYTGDRVWRFPLWRHYSNKITVFPEVDLHNVGVGVCASPCIGAAFLREFVVCNDWIHMDTTGTGMMSHDDEIIYLTKGRMTGRPTRTLVQFLVNTAEPA